MNIVFYRLTFGVVLQAQLHFAVEENATVASFETKHLEGQDGAALPVIHHLHRGVTWVPTAAHKRDKQIKS